MCLANYNFTAFGEGDAGIFTVFRDTNLFEGRLPKRIVAYAFNVAWDSYSCEVFAVSKCSAVNGCNAVGDRYFFEAFAITKSVYIKCLHAIRDSNAFEI